MSQNDSPSVGRDDALLDEQSWTERARRMIDYHSDARDFISRASEHFPARDEHVQLLLRLWVEADNLDAVILPLLDEMNAELMDNRGELDTTRGASARQSPMNVFNDSESEEVVYECIWSLNLASMLGVSVCFSVREDGIFDASVRGSASGLEQRVGYPIETGALQDALVSVYVAEATSK